MALLITCMIELLEPRQMLAAQAYDWRNVTMKGTGFVSGIVFSPVQQNLVYANTDMGGAYRWDQSAAKWTPLTDWIQSPDWSVNYNGAESIAVDPTDPNRVYLGLGTYMGPSAILRSTDQGRTWIRTNAPFVMNGNGPGRNAGQRMIVDPNSPNILFFATRNAGIYRSADYGATWNKLAGYTFTTDASGVTQDVGTNWIILDKTSGSSGSASQVLYAGAATTGATKVWRSTDGGTTWAALPGQVQTGNNVFPSHAVLTPDGNTLYLTFSVSDVGPNGVTGGFLYKVTNPKAASPTWSGNIGPTLAQGGYGGIAIDPNNPSTMFLGTVDQWWPVDEVYRSTNGGTTWTALGANAHRDNSSAPYAASSSIHWLGDVEVDPFNANHVMFNTGLGLFSSNNALAATPTWAFCNDGLEQSAVLELVSPNTGGANLISAIGDQDGFRHVDFSVSPTIGRLGQNNGLNQGTTGDLDAAWNDANYVVRATGTSPYVQYSNDNGVTWAWMSSTGMLASTGTGQIAISADGTRTIFEPDGSSRTIYAVRSGSTWSSWSVPATNRPADGAKLVADLASAATFYAYVGTTLSRSTDGGANWTVMTSSAPAGVMWIRAVPNNAGHLLLTTGGGGLWRSTNGGASWSRINSAAVTTANEVGVGAAAPGQSYPAIFVGGTVSDQNGFFRSDDQGATWTMISDTSHQYGDVTVIQGDPRVYGRLYVGTNGRGVLYADIHTPPTRITTGWTTSDIGAPGSAGGGGQPGTSEWELIGGGAGVGGTSDQFRFAYQQLNGDGAVTARVVDVPNHSPANNNAKAGVMVRASLASNSANVFAALTPGSVGGVVLQSRSIAGGGTSTVASATTGIWPPYWVRIVRSGNTFTAYRSPDGVTWTQLGTPQTITMGSSVYIGLAVTSSDNSQLNVSHFENVSITTPPHASITPVSPDPRGNAVSSFTLAFDEAVNGFDLSDLSLTRDGGAVSLSGATLTSSDGGLTWTLAGTASPTSAVGSYVLTLAGNGSGISAGGSPLAGGASDAWVMNVIRGSASADNIQLVRSGATTRYVLNGVLQYTFDPSLLPELVVDALNLADSLTLSGGASARLANALRLHDLTIDLSSSLEIGTAAIVVDAGDVGSWDGSAYSGLTGAVARGYADGSWTGAGITSAAAGASNGLNAVAIARAGDVLGIGASETASWRGQTVTGASVLLLYTYTGDADLDGAITGDDYFAIDSAFPRAARGWSNGDFNYDGLLTGDDYFFIDSNFPRQGPPL